MLVLELPDTGIDGALPWRPWQSRLRPRATTTERTHSRRAGRRLPSACRLHGSRGIRGTQPRSTAASVATVPARREELAAFLRSRRERIAPDDAGLIAGGRRRTPGLRREEVAHLAAVGVTWYTWLEQGRPINASADVLDAIARAAPGLGRARAPLPARRRHPHGHRPDRVLPRSGGAGRPRQSSTRSRRAC